MSVQIEITGVDKLIAKFDRIKVNKILTPPMRRALFRIERYMKKYPAKPKGSTYVRTRALGNRWEAQESKTITDDGENLTGTIANNVQYAPLVQSARFQVRVHRGRWRTDQMAVDELRAAIVDDFNKAIADALK